MGMGEAGEKCDEWKFSVRVSYFFRFSSYLFAGVTRSLCGEGGLVNGVKQNCLVMSTYIGMSRFIDLVQEMTRIPVPLTKYPGSRGPLSKRL